jgi:hypothetical protein
LANEFLWRVVKSSQLARSPVTDVACDRERAANGAAVLRSLIVGVPVVRDVKLGVLTTAGLTEVVVATFVAIGSEPVLIRSVEAAD